MRGEEAEEKVTSYYDYSLPITHFKKTDRLLIYGYHGYNIKGF